MGMREQGVVVFIRFVSYSRTRECVGLHYLFGEMYERCVRE